MVSVRITAFCLAVGFTEREMRMGGYTASELMGAGTEGTQTTWSYCYR